MGEDKKLNEVIRVQKRINNFVMLDKTPLDDTRLSFKAKGILAYLLSKPDNWKVIVKDLFNHSTDGETAIYSGLNELKSNGYYEKVPIKDKKGRVVCWESTVYELPTEIRPLGGFPDVENPEVENLDVEKPYLGNRDRNNNDISNKDFKKVYKDFNNNQSSQVLSAKKDRQDVTDESRIQAYTEILKENISYDDLEIAFESDIQLIDEMILIMLDVILTDSPTVKISNEDKPRALVKNVLMQLAYDDIQHVLWQFKSVTERISKKKQYLLTMLYNAKMENKAHLTNTLPPQYR